MKSLLRGRIYYSADVYRSQDDALFIATSSFRLKNPDGVEDKPWSTGSTPTKAVEALRDVVVKFTGRKDPILMAVHSNLDRWACLKCGARQSFDSKALLKDHDYYQHPAAVAVEETPHPDPSQPAPPPKGWFGGWAPSGTPNQP